MSRAGSLDHQESDFFAVLSLFALAGCSRQSRSASHPLITEIAQTAPTGKWTDVRKYTTSGPSVGSDSLDGRDSYRTRAEAARRPVAVAPGAPAGSGVRPARAPAPAGSCPSARSGCAPRLSFGPTQR